MVVLGPTLIIVILFGILLLATGRLSALRPFSFRRASTSMRSARGQNAALVLAVVALAQAALDLSYDFPDAGALTAGSTVALLLILVLGLAFIPRASLTVVTLLAIVLSLYSIGKQHGPEDVVVLLILIVLLLWILGLGRGFSGSD
jgi:hypothetical protein